MSTLKERNRPFLAAAAVLNLVVYVAIFNHGFSVETWSVGTEDVVRFSSIAIVSVVVGVLNAILDHDKKARLVFWRWKNPLPGSRAFSVYVKTDPRIDKAKVAALSTPMPSTGDEENALWFKWYREFKDEPSVQHAHREYLFTRDYAGISFLMILGLGGLSFYQFDSWKKASWYIALLIIQYLIVRLAAKNHGVRFVTTVMACKSSSI